MTKNLIITKIENLQESITPLVKNLKEINYKNLTNNIDKIKDLSQEKTKKYINSAIGVISIKNHFNNIKENDYTKLAFAIKDDVENKFNVKMDQFLNTFNISSFKETQILNEKIENIQKSITKIQKEIKKIK